MSQSRWPSREAIQQLTRQANQAADDFEAALREIDAAEVVTEAMIARYDVALKRRDDTSASRRDALVRRETVLRETEARVRRRVDACRSSRQLGLALEETEDRAAP